MLLIVAIVLVVASITIPIIVKANKKQKELYQQVTDILEELIKESRGRNG